MGLDLPPGLLLILGALAAPLLRAPLRHLYLLGLAALSLWGILELADGTLTTATAFGIQLMPVRADSLARSFAVVFHGGLMVGLVYALRERDALQTTAATVYAGSAIAALYAGDLLTLFVYWELTALSSVALVWAARNDRALRAGLRYLLWQIGSGVLLLAAAALFLSSGDVRLSEISVTGPAGALLLFGVGIKAAFPLLHSWVPDAYARATAVGAVFLSIFSTKLAIYVLARLFSGDGTLVLLGAAGALLGTCYAAAQSDARRMLAYLLVAQLGVSTAGIGLGGAAYDGALRHALVGVAYFGALFMAAGMVLERHGQARLEDFAGFARAMPGSFAWLATAALTGAGVPALAGYAGKAMILDEAALGALWVWLALVFAAAGAAYLMGLRLPAAALIRPPMVSAQTGPGVAQRVALGVAALACVVPGIWPALPGSGTGGHALGQLWLLGGVVLVYALARWLRQDCATWLGHPWDTDFAFRRAIPGLFADTRTLWRVGYRAATVRSGPLATRAVLAGYRRYISPSGTWGSAWPTGRILVYTATVLAAYLLLSFF